MTLTKIKMTERLMDEMEMDKPEAKAFVESFFEEIRATLEQGEQVKLSGFGNFVPRDKIARPGRNPKTGEEVLIRPRRVVTFRQGGILKKRIINAEN
ncbi:MAG: integration host factor subunit alpha [Planctomycetes bacterium]|nr:integration host factor subunit alpha [Planctomycetota bacterium]